MNTQWPGAGANSGAANFETLARQYWNAWGDAMRQGAPPAAPASGSAMPGWQDAIGWWSKLAQGSNPGANATVERFNAQARDWYGQMQQLAAQFAGQNTTPADITAQWKRTLGSLGENPFADMFRTMHGQGTQGLDQWMEAATPYLEAWRREGSTMLGMPTFGIGREHQQRWQKLAQAQMEYQPHENAYDALMMKAMQQAYEIFEGKLAEREEPGRQLTSARALFDLWIDSAEEAYSAVALSPQFREAYGARVNAQMRLRQAVQGEVEQMSAMFGMPTRSDLDIAFRKISELERALREMRDEMSKAADAESPRGARTTPGSGRKKPASRRAAKPASKAGTATKPSTKPAPKSATKSATKPAAKPSANAPTKGRKR